jgi:hypothetical protein
MKTSTHPFSRTRVCALFFALQLAPSAAVLAADAAAQTDTDAAPAANSANRDDSQLQTVVVSGIRANLEKALDT